MDRSHLSHYQSSVQKAASLMVWGGFSAYGTGNLRIRNAPPILKSLRATYTSIQAISFLSTAWLHSREVLGAGLACQQPRASRIWKYLVHNETQYIINRTKDCWAARFLNQTKHETTFLSKRSSMRSPQFSDVYRLLVKRRGDATQVFFEACCYHRISRWPKNFCEIVKLNASILPLYHSVVNWILAYEICI